MPANLEWVSYKENAQHAARIGRMRTTAVQTKIGGEPRCFSSTAEAAAAAATGVAQQDISRCIRVGKTAGGLEWTKIEGMDARNQASPYPDTRSPPEGGPRPAAIIGDNDPLWTELGLGEVIENDDPLWAELGLD